MSEIHPDLVPLAFLIGRWEGDGRGRYPTVAGFSYRETATFTAPPGKAFLFYQQLTWRAGDHSEAGSPLHTEAGYVRPAGESRAEMVVAQPTGIVEVLHGDVAGSSLSLHPGSVARTNTAKQVDSTERIISVDGDTLTYRVLIGAVGRPHQLHLDATLRRTG